MLEQFDMMGEMKTVYSKSIVVWVEMIATVHLPTRSGLNEDWRGVWNLNLNLSNQHRAQNKRANK